MKTGWKTLAIGRHLVDVPGDAKVIESWTYAENKLERLPVKNETGFKQLVDTREAFLKTQPQQKHGHRFIERVALAHESVLLISWSQSDSEFTQLCDTYFRADGKAIQYSGKTDPVQKQVAIDGRQRLSTEWREIKPGETPEGIGFVAGDMLLAAKRFNLESWNLAIKLAGKPDVYLQVSGFAQGKPEPGLRERAGGALAGMLGSVAGLQQLRNRKRPVGPIEADEILVAATQDGKRAYGFMWEAPGKGRSLAEPQLSISLKVGESAYTTNAESFATDEQALEVWDTVVDSIRLRPGAAG